jgi:hypothetical protein
MSQAKSHIIIDNNIGEGVLFSLLLNILFCHPFKLVLFPFFYPFTAQPIYGGVLSCLVQQD